jgi:phage baseplate assembly protein W
MKTFALRNKDFELGPGGYVIVTGPAKVQQDLGVAVREPLGIDRFHPGWGSLLPSFIGLIADDAMELRIRSEISRLIANYVLIQNEQIMQDSRRGRPSRFSTGELVDRIVSIEVIQQYDSFQVTASIQTVAGERVNLNTSVGA